MMSKFLSRDAQGNLQIDRKSCADLAEEFGTPCYAMSEGQIRENYRTLHDALMRYLGEARIFYAMKANPSLAILQILRQEGAGAECASMSEMTVALRESFPPELIILNGANKPPEAIEQAIRAGVSINIDGLEELQQVMWFASKSGLQANIRLRVTGEYLLTSSTLITSDRRAGDFFLAKWGMDDRDIYRACQQIIARDDVKLLGICFHLGLPRTIQAYRIALERALHLMAELRDRLNITLLELDIGGGLRYGSNPEGDMEDNSLLTPDQYVDLLASTITNLSKGLMGIQPSLILEPGRYLVGSAGILLTTIGMIRQRASTGPMVYVDTSFFHMPMIALTGSRYPVVPVCEANQHSICVETNITGQTCSPDFIGYRERLAPLKAGDLLAFLDVGAYAEAMSLHYNLIPRPASVLVNENRAYLIARRETLEDLLARQYIPDHLE